MIYFILALIIIGLWDIKELRTKTSRKELIVYIVTMLLVGILGIFYYSDPERVSFAKIILKMINKAEGL